MTEREKVIKGLECCISKDDMCDECPYMTGKEQIGEMNGEPEYVYGCDRLTLTTDALALLKAREPRVMTLEEARNAEVVWVEDLSTREVYPCIVKNNMNDSKLYKYGVQWRCWTSRPDQATREATSWN